MSLPRSARLYLAYAAARRAGLPRRRRGGQWGNRNAWKHGRRSAAALAKRRYLSTLLRDVKLALDVAKPFFRLRNRGPLPRTATNEWRFFAPPQRGSAVRATARLPVPVLRC